MTRTDDCKKWPIAPCDVEIIDVWPPGRLTVHARDAYDALARAGRIHPLHVKHDAAGRVIVRYLADIPAPWIHDELRAAKYQGKQMQIINTTQGGTSHEDPTQR